MSHLNLQAKRRRASARVVGNVHSGGLGGGFGEVDGLTVADLAVVALAAVLAGTVKPELSADLVPPPSRSE